MNIKLQIRRLLGHIAPKTLLKIRYKRMHGCAPDLKNPKTLDEKVMWLLFYGDTSKWHIYADKYAVRQYVESKGLGHMLVPLLGVWDNADDIDFDVLTPPYVLKVNNGSGSNIIIDEGHSYDFDKIRRELRGLLRKKFGYETGETHYLKIPPKIIAERKLDATKQDWPSNSLIDYKILCINGKAEFILIFHNRHQYPELTRLNLKGIDWSDKSEYFDSRQNFFTDEYKGEMPRPGCLDEMLRAAETLSAGLPVVRVDFYVVDGKPYFGEMTMTIAGCRTTYCTEEALLALGSKVSLPRR